MKSKKRWLHKKYGISVPGDLAEEIEQVVDTSRQGEISRFFQSAAKEEVKRRKAAGEVVNLISGGPAQEKSALLAG